MINVQKYLNSNYQDKTITELDLSGWNDKDGKWEAKPNWTKLTGVLDLSDFPNLEKLDCSYNQIASLNLSNCPNLTELKCWENELTEIKFPSSPLNLKTFYAWTNYLTEIDWNIFNSESLTKISISNNNLKEQNVDIFRQFTNLEELLIGNDIEERLENKTYNRFTGSLESLKNLTKLKKLQIEETDIKEDLQYLPTGSQIISWHKEAFIKLLDLDKNGEEAKKLRNTNKKDFFQVLSEIVIDHDVKKKLGSDFASRQEEGIRKIIGKTINANTRSKEELGKGLKDFRKELDKFIIEKQNEMFASIIPLERLYVIRGNIKHFISKWGTKEGNKSSELSQLRDPKEINTYWYVGESGQWFARATAVAGGVIAATTDPLLGGILAATSPVIEVSASQVKERIYEAKEKKWNDFLVDADMFLDNYNELLGILVPIKTMELLEGKVSQTTKKLIEKTKEFLKIYDEDQNEEISLEELINERDKLTQDLNKGKEESKVWKIVDAIKKLETSIIECRKLSYGISEMKVKEETELENQQEKEDEKILKLQEKIKEIEQNLENSSKQEDENAQKLQTEITNLEIELAVRKAEIEKEQLERKKNELETKLKIEEINYRQIKKELSKKKSNLILLKEKNSKELSGFIKTLEGKITELEQELSTTEEKITRINFVLLENQVKSLKNINLIKKIGQGWTTTYNGAKYCATKTKNFLTSPYWYWEQWKNRTEINNFSKEESVVNSEIEEEVVKDNNQQEEEIKEEIKNFEEHQVIDLDKHFEEKEIEHQKQESEQTVVDSNEHFEANIQIPPKNK